MNPADVRALLAQTIKSTDILAGIIANAGRRAANEELYDYPLDTDAEYLQQAHYLLEASWKLPHPAGMDNSRLGVDEAIALLNSKGYNVFLAVNEASTSSPS